MLACRSCREFAVTDDSAGHAELSTHLREAHQYDVKPLGIATAVELVEGAHDGGFDPMPVDSWSDLGDCPGCEGR
jgi:hypothetical protein